jgi:prevent-host-death family protein
MNPDTDRWVRSDEARSKFRDLLDEVAHDDAHIFVLRYDKPAAVIVPVEWYEQVLAAIGETGEPS